LCVKVLKGTYQCDGNAFSTRHSFFCIGLAYFHQHFDVVLFPEAKTLLSVNGIDQNLSLIQIFKVNYISYE